MHLASRKHHLHLLNMTLWKQVDNIRCLINLYHNYNSNDYFTTGNIAVCGWKVFELTHNITVHVVAYKHFFKIFD